MATLFIADLHLCVEEPAITAGFLRFLAGEARKADALYILGDLFEAWIGDDDPNPLHRKIIMGTAMLASSRPTGRTPILFSWGAAPAAWV